MSEIFILSGYTTPRQGKRGSMSKHSRRRSGSRRHAPQTKLGRNMKHCKGLRGSNWKHCLRTGNR